MLWVMGMGDDLSLLLKVLGITEYSALKTADTCDRVTGKIGNW